ncbi:MAG: hypothetical protein JW941_12360, partial [Candidatus Coatesbacteria bacterium]|nr:hypothetical protein [Candidatus Coatesbacteria bacterium]
TYRELYFVGLILPDLLGRLPMVLYKKSYWFITPGHTPIGALIGAYLISFLFEENIRPIVFRNITIGAAFHLLLDLLQRHVTDAYFWFFPLSWRSFEIPLFWPDRSIDIIPYLLPAVVSFHLLRWMLRRKRARRQ